LAASDELPFALQTVIFLHTLTLPPFWDHTPEVSVLHDPTQSSVYTEKLTLVICLIIHRFTCCKTVEVPYCPVTVLLVIGFNVLHYSRVSKFRKKFGNSARNLVI